MKKLTWALWSLVLLLCTGVAFADEAITVTLNPAPGTVADGTPVTITVAYADGYTANGVANWGLATTEAEAEAISWQNLEDYDETHQPVITAGKTWLKVRVLANPTEGGKTAEFVQSYEYTLEAGELPTPRIIVNGNPIESYEVTSDAMIGIICGEGSGCERWYTTDGSTPVKGGANSTKYVEAFEIGSLLAEGEEEGEVTIKAITVDGDKTSAVATARFTVAPSAVDFVFTDPLEKELKDTYGKYVELTPYFIMGEYPAAYQMYYTVDGETEPDEDAFDDQDGEDGPIYMISNNPFGDDDPVYIMFTENTTVFKAIAMVMPIDMEEMKVDQQAAVQVKIDRTMTAVEVDDLALKMEKADGKRVAKIENAGDFDKIYYTTDGTVPSYMAGGSDDAQEYDAEEGITLEAGETVKIIGYIMDRQLGVAGSDMIILPTAPTFAEPLEVKQGEGLKIDLPEDLDLADYFDGAFILYVENDDETELSYEGTWNELLAWAQGVRGGSDDEDPGYPGFPDDDLGGGGYALTVDEEPVAEPAYKVAYYDAEEEMWRPAAFLATAGDAVKVRACLAVGKDANGTLIYSDEFNATYKVTANTLKTPVFFVNDEELKTATVKVTPGTQVSFESGYEEADEADDYKYVICYAFDATEEDFDNASAWGMMMDPTSKVKMYDPEWDQIKVNKSGKLMARVAQMYRDGHIWWSASKEVTFEIDFVIEVSPLLGEDTFGKNIALGVSVNIGETNPIGMPIYADNKYPTAVYYTTDGTTEPSKAAYDAQADKVNGAIKMVANVWDEEEGYIMDGSDFTYIRLTFDKDVQFKAKGYYVKDGATVETSLFEKALKVKSEAKPTFDPVSGTMIKAGDKLVVKNPHAAALAPEGDGDEYAGQEEGEDLGSTLYFSFDGTTPTKGAYDAQTPDYDKDFEDPEFDPYGAYSVWKAEGTDVEIFIGQDDKGLYAYVPAIGEFTTYMGHKYDTIRIEGILSVDVFCVSEVANGETLDNGMSGMLYYGSDFVTAAYTVKGESPVVETVAKPTFNVKVGEVEKGTKVEIACETEGAVIYYTVDGSEPTAESTEYKEAIVINEDMTIKAIAIKGDAKSEVASATYTVKEVANEDLELYGVSVYPNPSNGLFNLELPCAATVEVFMSNGMLYQRINANAGSATLNIERSGIYFLRITGEGRTAIKRVIVR